MRARISLLGNDLLCEQLGADSGEPVRLPLSDETLARLRGWAEQYGRAVRVRDAAGLLPLGSEMFAWLDEAGWASRWASTPGTRELEIAVDDATSEAADVVLDLPWELLAHGGDFLAADPTQTFVVYRSIARGRNASPASPGHRDLLMMFMAAAPRGQRELDYEAEEAAILAATERLPLQVVVEESGCVDFLKDRLAQDGPFEVVHLSCHGTIRDGGGPVLALETPEGDLAEILPGDLAATFGERKPPLVFLSACRTAEGAVGPQPFEPFVRAMVRAGVPNVLGWDGSVYDRDATLFATRFYGELAEHQSVPYAAAAARREVLRVHRDDPIEGHHWHLARVYAGPAGAGAVCDRTQPKRKLRKDAGFKEFLDKANRRVRVATAQEFVGRRRVAQDVLRAYRDGRKAGVLIYGMGNSGKSSLAARIANRLPKHETVVAFERYDALAIFERLVAALPPRQRAEWKETWRPSIAADPAALADALEAMLEGPFDADPILLIIDDFEQILEKPAPEQPVTPIKDTAGSCNLWRASIAAVLRAFEAADTASHLLLTSRYVFTLPDGKGGDLADSLERMELPPMARRERSKQWRAAERLAGRTEGLGDDRELSLAVRAQAVAGGNPGLQEILCRPVLAGELDVAEEAVSTVEHWKSTGEVPEEESAAQEFFQRVSFETYRDALTADQRAQLRAATLFSEDVPIPIAAIEAVGGAAGVADPGRSLGRLIGPGAGRYLG